MTQDTITTLIIAAAIVTCFIVGSISGAIQSYVKNRYSDEPENPKNERQPFKGEDR